MPARFLGRGGHRDAAATEPWLEDDLDARVAFSYAMNRMEDGVHGDERGFDLWRAVYESLEG